MSWEEVFPGTQYNEEHRNDGSRLYVQNAAINYFISLCFFQNLIKDGAVRILSHKNDIRTYLTSNKFESCQHQTMDGGSLKINKGYIVQTKNSYLKSRAKEYGSAYISSSSQKFGISNQANETVVYNSGSTEKDNDMSIVSHSHGLVIMNQCNITKNKATFSIGPSIHNIYNDSHIICLNLIENTVTGPNCITLQHGTYLLEIVPSYVFNTSVFMKNKIGSDGSLITTYSNLIMDSCVIVQNDVQCFLDLERSFTVVNVKNTKTDNTNKKGPGSNMANIQTTNSVNNSQCSYFTISIPDDDKQSSGKLPVALIAVGVILCLALIGVVVFVMLKMFKPKVAAADEDLRVKSDPAKDMLEYELNEQGVPDTDVTSALLTTTRKPEDYFNHSDTDAFDTKN